MTAVTAAVRDAVADVPEAERSAVAAQAVKAAGAQLAPRPQTSSAEPSQPAEERPAPSVVGAGSQPSAAGGSSVPPAAEPDAARWHQLLRDPAVPLTAAMAARPAHLHLSP